jgi:hypothetical protein
MNLRETADRQEVTPISGTPIAYRRGSLSKVLRSIVAAENIIPDLGFLPYLCLERENVCPRREATNCRSTGWCDGNSGNGRGHHSGNEDSGGSASALRQYVAPIRKRILLATA